VPLPYRAAHALEDPAQRLVACVAPRGHAKSTCAAFAYPLWCICERRRRNIVIITHEGSLARQFVCDIRNEFESNDALRPATAICTAAATRRTLQTARAAAGRTRSSSRRPG